MKPQRVGQIYVSKWARPDCQKHRRLIRPRFLLRDGCVAAATPSSEGRWIAALRSRLEAHRFCEFNSSPIH
jgi:hypothetical protein